MRIDGTYGLGSNALPDEQKGPPTSPKPSDLGDSSPTGVDSQVRSTAEPYVQQVLSSEEVNKQAIADALRLLRSGELDSPESARGAAQVLLDLGI